MHRHVMLGALTDWYWKENWSNIDFLLKLISAGLNDGVYGGITQHILEYLMAEVTMRDMLKAGVHFGHQTRYWNPKMAQ